MYYRAYKLYVANMKYVRDGASGGWRTVGPGAS